MFYSVKRNGSILTAMLITIIALLLLASCSNNKTASSENMGDSLSVDLVNPECLTVTYLENHLPKTTSGEKEGTIEGYEGYLVTKVAEKLGVDVCPMPLPFSSQILSVKDGKADMGTSIYYTEERASEIRYTKPNIIDVQGLIVRKGTEFESPEEITNVGSYNGSATNQYFIDTLGVDNLKLYPGYSEALNALLNGQINGYAGSTGVSFELLKEYPNEIDFILFEPGDFGMEEDYVYSASHTYVGCENTALAGVINEVLDELKDSGKWKELRAKWELEDEVFIPPNEEPIQHCS